MSPASIGLLVLCNIVWALNVVISKIAVDDLGAPPLAYAAARSLLVVAVLLPFLRPVPERWGRVLVVGLAISGGSFALLFVGLQSASPSAAGVVSLSGAPMTVLFAIVFLREQVRWRRALGIALTFAGVLLAALSPGGNQSGDGLALVFLSAMIGALGAVFVKRLDVSSIRLQAWAGLASTVALTPASLLLEQDQSSALLAAPVALVGCLLFAGIVVSVGAHTVYYRILQRHDANQVVPLTLLTPLFTIGLGAWLIGDAIGWRLLLGAALAVAGVAIIVLRPSATFTRRYLVRSRL